MRFGYDTDGKLVPVEQLELTEAIADLDSRLGALDPVSVGAAVERLRMLLAESGEVVTPVDESVFMLWTEGIFDFRNVEDHFGQRIQRALLRKSSDGPSEA